MRQRSFELRNWRQTWATMKDSLKQRYEAEDVPSLEVLVDIHGFS